MLDLESSRSVILREVDSTIAQLVQASPTDWRRPVRCAGWVVSDLARHVAWGEAVQADGLRRMMDGNTDPPTAPMLAPDRDVGVVLDALREARDSMAGALQMLRTEHLERPCTIPFGTFPTMVVLQVCVVEAGMHANDLAWAFGSERPLPGDVVEATSAILGPALQLIAAGGGMTNTPAPVVPDESIAIRLVGPPIDIGLSYRDGTWQSDGVSGVPTCASSGSGSDLTLFSMGRIPATHSSLTIAGNTDLAAKFKSYFPGP